MTLETLPIRRGVGLIIDNGHNWILQKRDNKDGILWPGKISLWGGAMELEDHGDFEAAALREIFEETGLDSEEVTLECFGHMEFEHLLTDDQAVRQQNKLFVAKIKPSRPISIREGSASFALPTNPDLSKLQAISFSPGTVEALAKLTNYYENQS